MSSLGNSLVLDDPYDGRKNWWDDVYGSRWMIFATLVRRRGKQADGHEGVFLAGVGYDTIS